MEKARKKQTIIGGLLVALGGIFIWAGMKPESFQNVVDKVKSFFKTIRGKIPKMK